MRESSTESDSFGKGTWAYSFWRILESGLNIAKQPFRKLPGLQ